MKMITPIILTLMILLVVPMVYAEQTVKTVELPFGFAKNVPADYQATKNVSFNPSDGIKELLYGEIVLRGDFLSSTEVSGFIGQGELECNPSSITTPTIDVYNYEVTFDCSDKVSNYKGGIVPVKFNFTEQSKNVYGFLRITYYNNPRGNINIFGTEYSGGENGTVFLQLIDSNSVPVNNGSCQLTIYNPDINKTKLYENINMDFKEDGIYYQDLSIPINKGVYMIKVFCYYNNSGIKIEKPSVDIIYDGSLLVGSSASPISVQYTDCLFVKTTGSTYHEFRFNDSFIENINLSDIKSINLNWIGQHDKGDSYLQAWNYSSSSWVSIGSLFSKTSLGNCWENQGISRAITNGYDNFINGNEIRFRIYAFSGTGKIWTDDASIDFQTLGSYISDIKGSGEIHVGSVGAGNLTLIAEEVWDYNGTINNNIISQFVNQIWNYTGTIVNDILDAFSENIWTHTPSRNLTDFNFTVNTNETEIAEEVWNYEPRNLTYYPNMTCNPTLNATCELDYDLDEEDIWTYGNRTLTDFNFIVNTTLGNITVNATNLAEAVWNYNGTINNNILNQIADKVQCYIENFLTEEDDKWKINIPVC